MQSRTDQNELKQYNTSLKQGLRNGLHFTKLMDQIINTQDHQTLFTAARKLAHYHLDTEFVHFPYQYRVTDYYLIFMDRLLTQHHHERHLTLTAKHWQLFQGVKELGAYDSFYFEPARSRSDHGEVYKDSRYHETLFYLNVDQKIMRFDSLALTKLFIIRYLHHVDPKKIKAVVNVLITFGQELQEDYDFNVDFSILATNNQKFYHFKRSTLSHDLLDELFISAANHKYMLKSYLNYGAQLCLPNNLRINISSTDHNGRNWGLVVKDPQARVSWFDVILQFDFLRDWYLDHLSQLLLR